MATISVSEATRKRLAELAAREGKSVEAYIEEILERTAMKAETAEDLIKKLGLEEISEPSPARRSRRRGGAVETKKRAKR